VIFIDVNKNIFLFILLELFVIYHYYFVFDKSFFNQCMRNYFDIFKLDFLN